MFNIVLCLGLHAQSGIEFVPCVSLMDPRPASCV